MDLKLSLIQLKKNYSVSPVKPKRLIPIKEGKNTQLYDFVECRLNAKKNPVDVRKATVMSSMKAAEMKGDFINSKKSRKMTSLYLSEESDLSSPKKCTKDINKDKKKSINKGSPINGIKAHNVKVLKGSVKERKMKK
jgi:hypothetical protein